MGQTLLCTPTEAGIAHWTAQETLDLVNALTRRRVISAATAVALLSRAGASLSAQPPGATPAGSREVLTDKGMVVVPNRAQRVVCADFYGAFAVVDLGLTPIGAGGTGFDQTGEPYASALEDVPSVGDFLEPDLESILALAPDLILRTIDTDDDLYGLLSEIAPTVVLSFQSLNLQDVAVRVGDVLGRQREADELLRQYETRCMDIATTFARVLDTTTFSFAMSASESTFWLLGPSWTDTTVMVDCGVRIAEPSASQDGSTAEYSMEELGLLDQTDVIFINAEADGRTPAPDTTILTDSPLWHRLPAVQADRVFAIPYGAASLGAGIVLTERLEEILAELDIQESART